MNPTHKAPNKCCNVGELISDHAMQPCLASDFSCNGDSDTDSFFGGGFGASPFRELPSRRSSCRMLEFAISQKTVVESKAGSFVMLLGWMRSLSESLSGKGYVRSLIGRCFFRCL